MAIKQTEEEFIDNLIQPISDIYQETNSKVLSIMVNRIKQIGTLSPTDAGRLSILLKNQDLKQIEKALSDATKLSIKQIDSIVEESATYNDDLSEKLYRARNMPPATFATDSALLNVVDVAKKNIVDSVVNLSKTTGFMINGKMTSVAKTYNYAVNRATFEVQQGLFDFNTSLRSVVKELSGSGIRTVDFESGYSRRLDSQARLNLHEGISRLNMNYREVQGEQFGSDGVEISVHGLCAPDHIKIQGRQYSTKEFELLQSTLERPIGTLNCKHVSMPIILGISKPVYSDSELEEVKNNSNKQVKYQLPSGKTVERTRYEATQDQRNQETKIRRLKDVKNQLDIMGDSTGSSLYQRKIKEQTAIYKKMSEQMGISPKMDRLWVFDGKPIKSIKENSYKIFENGEDANTFFGKKPERLLRRENREEYDRQMDVFNNESQFGKWKNSISEMESYCVGNYTSGDYSGINGYCRKEMTEKMVKSWDDLSKYSLKENIENITSAISKFDLKEDIKLYRTCEADILPTLRKNIGNEFIDNGFTSTSVLSEKVASGNVNIVIDVPHGKGVGAYINPLSAYEDKEYEFLLQRGTSFRVDSIDDSASEIKVHLTVTGNKQSNIDYATKDEVIEHWKRINVYDEELADKI